MRFNIAMIAFLSPVEKFESINQSIKSQMVSNQPQPGSFFQRPREAEEREPGNEVDSCQDAQPNVTTSGIITKTSVKAVINALT